MENNKQKGINILNAIKKNKKFYGILALVAVILIGVVFFVKSRPKNILSDLKVTYSGYDGMGELSYDKKKINSDISSIALKKAGFSKEIIDAAMENVEDGEALLKTEPNYEAKIKMAENYLTLVELEFNKETQLSNGDEIICTLTNKSDALPIKSGTKTFKVSGLKDSKKVTIKQVLKKYNYTFKGYDGTGIYSREGESSDDGILEPIMNNGSLSNKDNITLKLTTDCLADLRQKGQILTGKNMEKIKVTGLKEITTISNLPETLDLIDNLAKKGNQDSSSYGGTLTKKYTIERCESYIKNETSNAIDDEYDTFSVVTLYKITETVIDNGKTENKVNYKSYGYDNVEEASDKLEIDNLSSYDAYSSAYDVSESLDGLRAVIIASSSAYKKIPVKS